MEKYKLVYEKEGVIKGTRTGIPSSEDNELITRKVLEGEENPTPQQTLSGFAVTPVGFGADPITGLFVQGMSWEDWVNSEYNTMNGEIQPLEMAAGVDCATILLDNERVVLSDTSGSNIQFSTFTINPTIYGGLII